MNDNVPNDELHKIARARVERIAANRTSEPVPADLDRAAALLAEWWLAGLGWDLSPDDFDYAADLPGAAYDTVTLVAARERRRMNAEAEAWTDTGSGPGWAPGSGVVELPDDGSPYDPRD